MNNVLDFNDTSYRRGLMNKESNKTWNKQNKADFEKYALAE